MGMTVWVQVLNGRKIEGNQSDCSWMHRVSEPLDAICQQHGVEKLTAFFDYTDLEHNMGEGGEDDDEAASSDPETGWTWGIDGMKWFPAASGLRTLLAMIEAMDQAPSVGDMPPNRKGELFAELQDCVKQLETAAKLGQMFHFTVSCDRPSARA